LHGDGEKGGRKELQKYLNYDDGFMVLEIHEILKIKHQLN
jgi:hypothetical protein